MKNCNFPCLTAVYRLSTCPILTANGERGEIRATPIRCVLNYFELCILRKLVPRSLAAQAKFIIRCRITWKHFWADAASAHCTTWQPKGAVIHQNLCSQQFGFVSGSLPLAVAPPPLYIHTHFFVAAHII